MKKLLFFAAVFVAFFLLLRSAMHADLTRKVQTLAEDRAHLMAEIKKKDEMFISALRASPKLASVYSANLSELKTISDPEAFDKAFERLALNFQSSGSAALNPENPLDRKLSDELQGALNRRDVIKKDLLVIDEECEALRTSTAVNFAKTLGVSVTGCDF